VTKGLCHLLTEFLNSSEGQEGDLVEGTVASQPESNSPTRDLSDVDARLVNVREESQGKVRPAPLFTRPMTQ